jgi:hypothetical protein
LKLLLTLDSLFSLLELNLIIMTTLTVIVNGQGRPFVELAAAAYATPFSWTSFHTLIGHAQLALFNDVWSSKFHHGIAHETCRYYGLPEQYAALSFTSWLTDVLAQAGAAKIKFWSPQSNTAEVDFMTKWSVVGCALFCHFVANVRQF